MKKITAVLVIFSLLWGNFSAVYAQMPRKFIQGSKAAKESLQRLQTLPEAVRAANTIRTAALVAQVERASRTALLGKTPKFEELRLRALQGRTSFLSKAILAHPVPAERTELLRRHFAVTVPEASAEEVAQAAEFWRRDLNAYLPTLSKDASYDALADAAALGIFGTPADLTILESFYKSAKNTPMAAEAAAVWTRALAVHGQYDKLAEFFTKENGVYPALQNGLADYARLHGWQADIPEVNTDTPAAPSADLTEFGLACRLAGDPSKTATAIWVSMARHRAAAAVTAARPVTLKVPQAALKTPENLALSALEIPAETAAALAPEAGEARPAESAPAADGSLQFFAKNTPKTDSHAGEIYGGIPLPALWRAAKQTLAKIKTLFTRTQAPAAPTAPGAEGTREAFQRLGIYMASYVMGLEVATPVIANFGSSFGLSLEENILVAVATYLPYSLGAFFSNWTKKVLGRRNSMNLGLALLGGGLLAGVTLCGLNGAFVPEANAMMHFYKALACITAASLGGVLVHNSVGPIMTELSQNASDLVRQKRNTYTEFSRAIGMASSFAFPFIATKVLGMDWSLAFALPLPLVGAAALGVNLAKIPNTKPLDAPKTDLPQTKGLIDSIKKNEYVRLFKEEKGVGAFLGGLFIMNAVEMAINSGFLFLLPSMTSDQSSQYLFGLAQFAAPFLLGRYLAGKFLQWFPKHNMSVATLLAAGGSLVSLGLLDNVYALTTALFLAETGISTGFTLGFARTAKNPATQDRIVSLIVASAISCAFGPLLLTNLAQTLIDSGIMSAETATAAAMLGIPSGLALLSALLFKRVENLGEATTSMLQKIYSFIKKSVYHPKQRRKRS
ncbi:MAG: MFS transporter [Elusimicrobiaceae bacterium]|nr:MFS transporter [Elusimicrobiaceae bacterium]